MNDSAPARPTPFPCAGNLINAGQRWDVRNPWDESIAGSTFLAQEHHLDRAIEAATEAFADTRDWPVHRRQAVLRKIASQIEAQRETLAETICAEAGKPIQYARAEVDRGAITFRSAAEVLATFGDQTITLDLQSVGEGRAGLLRRFPLGPVAAITPFNFPLNLVAHKLAPAIAVGAPVVHKPARQTPLTALALASIVREAGWPSAAYSVLPMSAELGQRLASDPRLPVLSFTGSPDVGWKLKQATPRKRVCLELGGNAAVIVHEDAELAEAARRCAVGGFAYAGQTCISVQRVLAHEAIYESFREMLIEAVSALNCGDPADPDTQIGPMIAESEAQRAEAWIEAAIASGAVAALRGSRRRALMTPSILEQTTPLMDVECREVFAPIVTLTRYDRFETALEHVNGSRFGLQAAVFTQDLGRIMSAWRTLEVGAVVINDASTFRVEAMPYGGVKDSGFGREGVRWAMEEMTEPRLLAMRSR
ncbi:MAG: aldehyde dehydrogenase family protein [Acidobacteriota bacterium]